ncbi:unnamed protein product [Moneuplotes crassus]|uniref:Uncharacterized protein n=1 Tax=Euplotes crassus TaxID=5936 RepID=A0AAD1XU90_EUPCR|nr:unnamed protein product [Moneuplotes crassus]
MSDESVHERLYSGKSSSRNLTIKDTKISGLSNLITSWSKTSKRSKGKFTNKIKAYKSFQELPLVGRNAKLLKEFSGNQKFSKERRKSSKSKERRKSSKSKESPLAVSISNKLYSDAIQRKKVKGKKPKIAAPKKRVSTKSNKLLFQRFLEDFELVSRVRKIRKSNVSILDKRSKTNIKIDKVLGYQEVEMFCKDLGFLSEGFQNNEEKILFVDLWACLHGDIHGGVSQTNLKILLAAIQGFKIDISADRKMKNYMTSETHSHEEEKYSSKSSCHSNHLTDKQKHGNHNYSDSRDTTKFICFEVGEFINEILHLDDKDIKRCQKYFILLSRNRSKFLKERKRERYDSRKKNDSPSYKPKINTHSETLVKGILDNLSENKIPHYELLLYKGKEYQKNKAKLIKQKELLEMKNSKKLSKRCRKYKPLQYQKETIIDYLDEAYEDGSEVLLKLSYDMLENENNVEISNTELSEIHDDVVLEEDNQRSEDTFSQRLQNLEDEDILPSEKEKEIEPNRYPILYVDINLGDNHIERITIFEEDDIEQVAKEFAETHNLNDKMYDKLQRMLQNQMAGILSRINEEVEELEGNSIEK